MKTATSLFTRVMTAAMAFTTMCASGMLSAQVTTAPRQQKADKAEMVREAVRLGDASYGKNMKIRVLQKGDAYKAAFDYGKEVTVTEEDFSLFATGTMEEPDRATKICLAWGEYEYPWMNVLPEFTRIPGWGGSNLYSAGGTVYMESTEEDGQGHLNTPMLNVEGYGGIVICQFSARTPEGMTLELLGVEAAETHNMGPTWDVLGAVPCTVTDEWQTFEVTFYGGGPYTLFNLVSYEPTPVYIDDVKVYQIDQYVETPELSAHSNYKGTSFDANWKSVEGAEAYLLTVFSYDEISQVPSYVIENQKVEGTSFTVQEIESGMTYYYTVRAVKGEHTSIESYPMEVFDLEAPVLNPVSGIEKNEYAAGWNDVPSAEVYNYWAYHERVAEADGVFVITDENFDGVKDAEGNETGFTIENPSYDSYPEYYIPELKQGGWKGKRYCPYTDYAVVDGWWYWAGEGDSGLLSPELDLSKDGGNISLSVRLYGEFVEGYDADNNPYELQTGAAIALFNYSEDVGDYEQAELVYADGLKNEWGTFEIKLTKGSARSIIGIYAVAAPGILAIDDLRITQNYKKGEKFIDPFLHKHYHAGTSVDVRIPERVGESNIYHKVSAVKSKSQGEGAMLKESEFSALESVGKATSIIRIAEAGASVEILGGRLSISNPARARISVCNVDGVLICPDEFGENVTVDLPGRGIFIVKIGSEVTKVIF